MPFSPDARPELSPPEHAAAVREAHGERWTDEHAWPRADDWPAAVRDPAALPPGIRAHLEAENAHVEAPLALVTNLSAGHSGESGRHAGLDEEARALAFAIAAVGREEPG